MSTPPLTAEIAILSNLSVDSELVRSRIAPASSYSTCSKEPHIGVGGVIWIFAMMYLLAAILGIFLKTPELGGALEIEADIVAVPH